jgi:hypothetical protein
MKNDYGHVVTDEDAQLHLASLSRLFFSYAKVNSDKKETQEC